MFSPTKYLIIDVGTKYKNKYKLVKKWFVNRNTPLGEPADFYEIKPHGGKKLIQNRIAAVFEDGTIGFLDHPNFKCEYDKDGNFIDRYFVAENSLVEFISNLDTR